MSYQPNPLESSSALSVNTGYQTWFYDSWSAALDTTDKWTVTGTAPTVATGLMTMSATVSTYNTLRTKDSIRANVGYAHVRNGIQLETTAATGAGRFWGLGTNATTPAAAVLVQDGIGFEIDQAAGSLLAVTYAAGVRTTVGTLTRPTDGAMHAYGLSFRATRAYWFIDDLTNPVLSIAFPNVQVAILPALIVRQNAASFTGTPVFANTAHLTADTSRQGTVLSDPDIGTRQARVKAPSTAVLATDSALAVGLHPSSPLPAGTNSLGTVLSYRPGTSTPTTVGSSATSVTLLAANTNRAGATITNNSSAVLYVEFGATASATAYTVALAPISSGIPAYYEVPFGYRGVISGIWASANGNALVRELT